MAEITAGSRKFSLTVPLKEDGRISAVDAGYMELDGAIKDSDCEKVKVDGGVGSEKSCCNNFEPQGIGTWEFKCGVCKYLIVKGGT